MGLLTAIGRQGFVVHSLGSLSALEEILNGEDGGDPGHQTFTGRTKSRIYDNRVEVNRTMLRNYRLW